MRRRIVITALSVLALASVFAACADLGGLSGTQDEDAGAGGGNVADGAASDVADGGATPDVVVEDATSRDDATTTVDAASCTTCDCDEDKYGVRDAGCSLGTFDCDDLDPLVNPGANFVSASWTSPHVPAGDWNCDGVATKQYPFGKVCPFANNCSGQGFEGDPPCGATADFFDCISGAGTLCQKVNLGPRTQACK